MLVLDPYRYSMLPISPPRRTKSLRSLGGSIRTLFKRDDSRGHIREPRYLFPKEPTLELSRFRSGPRQTTSNLLQLPYKVTPPPPEFHDWALKVFHATADFSPDFVHAHDQHQGDSDIQTKFGRTSTIKTITPRVAQPTSTLTTQPSIHHVKDGRAKDARKHESVRQLFHRNSRASWKTLGRVTQKVNALNYHPIFEISHRQKLRSGCVKLAS